MDQGAVDRRRVDIFLEAQEEPPPQIILDLESRDDPLHGEQEGRFFHGYYGDYGYLPLYIFCGEMLLGARLRVSNLDGAAGSQEELQRMVGQIRQAWSGVQIMVRGDSGFCREELMVWCQEAGVDYVLGWAKNDGLKAEIAWELQEVAEEYQGTGKAARRFKEFEYQTRESWGRARRVVGKAEVAAATSTIRLKLLKIGAQIRVTVRKVWVSMAGGYPYAELWARVHAQLQAAPLQG
jgi:hypothetical protein